MANYAVTVDKEACIGAGSCTEIDGALFKLVDGKATVLRAVIDESQLAKALEAARSCPSNAISIKNLETNSKVE